MRTLFLTLFLLSALHARGQLAFEKTTLEFTKRSEDRQVEAVFKFRNDSGSPVTIRSVRASCGCTTASLPKTTYAPGEAGEITALFKFGFRTGRQIKEVTVRYEDESLPDRKLRLDVQVGEAVTFEPKLVFWRIGDPPTAKTIRIQAEPGVQLGKVSSVSDAFRVSLDADGNGGHAISVTPISTDKRLYSMIVLETVPGKGEVPRYLKAYARVQ